MLDQDGDQGVLFPSALLDGDTYPAECRTRGASALDTQSSTMAPPSCADGLGQLVPSVAEDGPDDEEDADSDDVGPDTVVSVHGFIADMGLDWSDESPDAVNGDTVPQVDGQFLRESAALFLAAFVTDAESNHEADPSAGVSRTCPRTPSQPDVFESDSSDVVGPRLTAALLAVFNANALCEDLDEGDARDAACTPQLTLTKSSSISDLLDFQQAGAALDLLPPIEYEEEIELDAEEASRGNFSPIVAVNLPDDLWCLELVDDDWQPPPDAPAVPFLGMRRPARFMVAAAARNVADLAEDGERPMFWPYGFGGEAALLFDSASSTVVLQSPTGEGSKLSSEDESWEADHTADEHQPENLHLFIGEEVPEEVLRFSFSDTWQLPSAEELAVPACVGRRPGRSTPATVVLGDLADVSMDAAAATAAADTADDVATDVAAQARDRLMFGWPYNFADMCVDDSALLSDDCWDHPDI